MLEVRHISKTYETKKGVTVKALSDVTVSFGDTGLVFILGKSGSGKSTFLNVVGGLDRADEGEFIFDGKYSEDFKGSDFDSYRNTFVGFIFQEYNLLEEFNVAQNVALAMELQNKKATKERVSEILREVDLSDFGARKPNELSGGQKQRVAIARALVKDPKIIMADEPTGALDSNTGKQVFDTLKKLSKTKLVLVVSHDREFAEYYGDRVIELADGKIISDITKFKAENGGEEGLSVVDGKILRIAEGYELTEKDLAFINDYLRNRRAETIVSCDAQANESLKRAAKIDETGGKDSFRNTEELSPKELGITDTSKRETKFVRSRMPLRKAFRMGASSLKTKPLRLFFTILLSFVSLAMFGLTDTIAAYDKAANALRSIEDVEVNTAVFVRSQGRTLHERQIGEIESETGIGFKGLLSPSLFAREYYQKPNILNISYISKVYGGDQDYYTNDISGFYELTESELSAFRIEKIAGRLPTRDDEIAVSKYFYECYNEAGYVDRFTGETIPRGELTADDGEKGLIGKTLAFNPSDIDFVPEMLRVPLTVTGIVDTKIPEKYETLKIRDEKQRKPVSVSEFSALLNGNIHNALFVAEGFQTRAIDALKELEKKQPGYTFSMGGLFFHAKNAVIPNAFNVNQLRTMETTDANDILWISDPKASLSDDEFIVSSSVLKSCLRQAAMGAGGDSSGLSFSKTASFYENGQKITREYDNLPDYLDDILKLAAYGEIESKGVPSKFIEEYRDKIEEKLNRDFDGEETMRGECERIAYFEFLTSERYSNPYGKSANMAATEIMAGFLDLYGLREAFTEIEYSTENFYEEENRISAKTLGFYAGIEQAGQSSSYLASAVVSDNLYVEFALDSGRYASCIAPMPQSRAQLKKLLQYHYEMEENELINGIYKYSLVNQVTSTIQGMDNIATLLSNIFLIVGITLAVFSALLLANFISVSIAGKKREIGILRAVGARSIDVFSIFYSESLIISVISIVLALIASIAGSIAINVVLATKLGISVSLMNFGIRQICLMIAVSFGVSAIASFLPVYRLSKKKPVDAIRGR